MTKWNQRPEARKRVKSFRDSPQTYFWELNQQSRHRQTKRIDSLSKTTRTRLESATWASPEFQKVRWKTACWRVGRSFRYGGAILRRQRTGTSGQAGGQDDYSLQTLQRGLFSIDTPAPYNGLIRIIVVVTGFVLQVILSICTQVFSVRGVV